MTLANAYAACIRCVTVYATVSIFVTFVPIQGNGRAHKLVSTGEANRPVTVADAIFMTRLADPQYIAGGPPREVATFCPNGTKFVVIVRKGNLEENTNEYLLLLWKTKDIFRSQTPEILVRMSSSSNRPAIEDVTWLSDNDTLAFVGEQTGTTHQLYTIDVRTHELRQVTKHDGNVLSARMSLDGLQIAFVAEAPPKSFFDEASLRNGVVVTSQRLSSLITGQAGGSSLGESLFFQSQGHASHRIELTAMISSPWGRTPFLSPDGRHIAILTRVAHVPQTWSEYADPLIQHLASQEVGPEQYSWLGMYVLVDTSTGRSRILLESPVGPYGSEVVWLPGSNAVAVAGVYLPLDRTSGDERTDRRKNLYTVEVNVETGAITKITDRALTLDRWDPNTNALVFEAGRAKGRTEGAATVRFHKRGNQWEETSEPAKAEAEPQIILQEDMNTPPRLFAIDLITHGRALLLDFNLQFEHLDFGRVEELHWKGTNGREVVGGLYYPVKYISTRRYPLVIQTHGWRRDRFWIDGPYTTGFAAQPLAGKGIMVLQLPQPDEDEGQMDTPSEVDAAILDLENAIDLLDSRGMIDLHRIGIIGFSRTCLYVKYALTHSHIPFAAASLNDGVDGGYFQYVENLNLPAFAQFEEGINGGNPFGEGLKSWVARSPTFSIEKVETPVRILAPNTSTILAEWEWFAALTRLAKPVEMIALHDGDHILEKPWERMVSQQGNLDWFGFWLLGEQDANPFKANQYRRWRSMRDRMHMQH